MKKIIFSTLVFVNLFTINAQQPVKLWETDTIFSGPESVVYDSVREFLYISNLRRYRNRDPYYGDDFISRINLKGEVVDLKWITNLTEPTGICIFNDDLYIVERFGVVVYDLKKDQIKKKIWIKSSHFLNDISVGNDSTIFVSASDSDMIYCFKNDKLSKCYQGHEIARTNGILYDGDKLIIAANSDSTLKEIDLKSGEITVIAQMKKGIIDGIKIIDDDYLVSYFEGILYRVTKEGSVTEILNTKADKINMADFEYIESKKMLIVPALWNHRIIAHRLE